MLHGFGGSSYIFQQLYRPLHRHYQLHSLDGFGVGYSSLGNYTSNCEQTLHYHLDAIEEWRKAAAIPTMHLMGFSLGGYIAAAYAEMYHKANLIIASRDKR